MNRTTRRLIILPLALGAALLSSCSKKEVTFESYEPWDAEIVERFKAWPVLEGGRVKPMQAVARVRLLRYRARKGVRFYVGTEGEKLQKVDISPTEFLLDALFRPELASEMPVLNVNDSDAVVAIGVEPHTKRRSKYSFNELIAGREKLSELRDEYAKIEEKERTGKQNQIVDLGRNVAEFEYTLHFFDWARDGVNLNLKAVSPDLSETDTESIRLTEFFTKLPEIQALNAKKDGESDEDYQQRFNELMTSLEMASGQLGLYVNTAKLFTFFPPEDIEDPQWLTPAQVLEKVLGSAERREMETSKDWLSQLVAIEDLARAQPNSSEFKAALAKAQGDLEKKVALRLKRALEIEKERIAAGETDYYNEMKEGEHLQTELALYRGNYYGKSLIYFIISFLLVTITWLSPVSKFGLWVSRGAYALSVIALGYLLVGIVLRGIIMDRWPLGNLYETIIFITAVCVLLALIIELFVSWKIALSVAAALGMIGMFLSMLFDTLQGQDTMDPLVAVLRSNFWLSTHVTAVTFGYAAGLLAGAIAHLYIMGKFFGWWKDNPKIYTVITRMVYGVVCFALLFSLVGTILGGIWANMSWGRFWGWDPKENGAFMIVLWNLVILHLRMGGYAKELGINILAVIGGMIVAFSWWWVNVMGVGLHSYGFTAGIKLAVLIYWGIELCFVILGVVVWYRKRYAKEVTTAAPAKKVPAT